MTDSNFEGAPKIPTPDILSTVIAAVSVNSSSEKTTDTSEVIPSNDDIVAAIRRINRKVLKLPNNSKYTSIMLHAVTYKKPVEIKFHLSGINGVKHSIIPEQSNLSQELSKLGINYVELYAEMVKAASAEEKIQHQMRPTNTDIIAVLDGSLSRFFNLPNNPYYSQISFFYQLTNDPQKHSGHHLLTCIIKRKSDNTSFEVDLTKFSESYDEQLLNFGIDAKELFKIENPGSAKNALSKK